MADLAALDARPRRVLVVENEVSYLSLPLPDGEVVVFGSGYTVAALGRIPWLAECPIDYWGDLDTTASRSSTDCGRGISTCGRC